MEYTQRSTSEVKKDITNTPTDSALTPKIHISLQKNVIKVKILKNPTTKLKHSSAIEKDAIKLTCGTYLMSVIASFT